MQRHLMTLGLIVLATAAGAGLVYFGMKPPARPSVEPVPESPERGEEQQPGTENAGGERTVQLQPEKLASLQLNITPVRKGNIARPIELSGEVQWNTNRLAHITPPVPGIVMEVKKTLGDQVQEGELLAVLASREMGNAKMEYLADIRKFEVDTADYDRAQTVYENTKKLLEILDGNPTPEQALEKAHDLAVGENKNKLLTAYTRMRVNQQNFERLDKLRKQQISSEASWLEAKGNYEVSRTDYASTREEIMFNLELNFLQAKKQFELGHTELKNSERALHILGLTNEQTTQLKENAEELDMDIGSMPLYSPINGIIAERHLTRGEMVKTEEPLYTIADTADVWVLGRVYESELRFLAVGQKATVRLDAYPDEMFEGTVDYVGTTIDPDTRTVEARVVLPNPEKRLRPGMFGVVTVFSSTPGPSAATAPASVLVPVDSLQRSGKDYVVFRVVRDGVFEAVPVQVLTKSPESAEVSGKLTPDDRVAAGETFILKSELDKESMGEGD